MYTCIFRTFKNNWLPPRSDTNFIAGKSVCSIDTRQVIVTPVCCGDSASSSRCVGLGFKMSCWLLCQHPVFTFCKCSKIPF